MKKQRHKLPEECVCGSRIDYCCDCERDGLNLYQRLRVADARTRKGEPIPLHKLIK